MRLIYFYINYDERMSGVTKKIIFETQTLKENHVNIEIFTFSSKFFEYPSDLKITSILLKCLDYSKKKKSYCNIILCDHVINGYLRKMIKSLNSGDIVYMRFPYPSFDFWRAIRKPRKCKIVTEHQTKEFYENLLSKKYLYFFIDFLFGKKIKQNLDGIVGVTDEITNYQIERIGGLEIPHISIGNGFDVRSVPLRDNLDPVGRDFHLLCVANVNTWHGLDRLLRSIALYCGKNNINFHIAGDGPDIIYLKQLVDSLNLDKRIIFHGYVTGAALDNLFNTCHIAVGSLGIHRIGLTESSTLKVREYCARGIPWIIACKDPDFPDDFPYIHRIPADESPVNIEEVIEFAKRVYADPDHPQKMRAYAVEHLDWSVKMKKLKTFLESLVDESPSIS